MEQKSFWLEGEQQIYPILRGRRSADAVVVGGGLSGLTIALWLCRAGLRVTLLEAETLGCGASGRCGGMITLSNGLFYDRLEQRRGLESSAAYGQTMLSAFQALRELAGAPEAHTDWRDTDAYLVSNSESIEPLEREAEAMKRAGIAAEVHKATQSPLPAQYALWLRNMATLHPMKYLKHLIREGEAHQLKLYEHSRVTALETNLVYTERGSVMAPYIVIATGYPIVNIPGWYFLRLIQRQSFLLPIAQSAPFDGMYLDAAGGYAMRRYQEGVLFQLNGSRVGEQRRLLPLEQFQARYAPYFEGRPANRVYVGLETYSADGLPYIGPYSRMTPNLFVAAGYGGQGLLGSMIAAQAISAKVLGLPGDGYSIYSGRRGSSAVWADEAKTALGISGRYIKSMFRFRAPRCPHLGCKLVYRPKQRIWECPCHGSRFDDIGHIINAPSVRDATIRHTRRGR